jgi:hypothetical protein
MKHRNISIMALAIIVLSTSVYAADGHDHGNENNAAPMGAGSLSHGHDDKLHFSVKTPGTVAALHTCDLWGAWACLYRLSLHVPSITHRRCTS